MTTNSPDSYVGSGGKLAAELLSKADLEDNHVERTLHKRDDLRIAAMEKYASQKVYGSDAFPLIRAATNPPSPNKTTSTYASDGTAIADNIPSLGRQGSATFSTGNICVPRSNRSASPTKRPVSAVRDSFHEIIGHDSVSDQLQPSQPTSEDMVAEDIQPSGLDFLLQACDILEPGSTDITNSKNNKAAPRRRSEVTTTTRSRRTGRPSDEGEFNFTPNHSSDEDGEYRPSSRRVSNRPARRASARAAALTSAQPTYSNGSTGKSERNFVNGPCTNPDCEHPYDSPQWRKGPPSNPVLCNACGTRWLRNGSLKPLVPRRGIRYGKARPKGSVKAAAEARAARKQAAQADQAAHQKLAIMDQEYYEEEEEEEYNEDQDMIMQEEEPPIEEHQIFVVPTNAPSLPAQHMMTIQEDPQALLARAMQTAGLPLPFAFGPSVNMQAAAAAMAAASTDPSLLQQQLLAMAAAAQATQQAYIVAQMEQLKQMNEMKAAANAQPTRPVFNIIATTNPTVIAPRFDPSS